MDFTTVRPGKLSIVASGFDVRPLSFLHDGQRSGYEPSVARAVCERLGLEPEWFNLPVGKFYQALSSGEYDVVWFNQAITQERRAWADFTRPYGRFDEAVLALEESLIHEPRDLRNKRLGSMEGITEVILEEQFPETEFVPFSSDNMSQSDMLDPLRAKDVHALVGNALVLMAIEADDPTFRVAFQLTTQRPFGIGVLPGNRELLDALNSALNALLVDGTLQKLWAQWLTYKSFPF